MTNKKVPNSDIVKIKDAHDKVIGTTAYTKFLMETYSKVNGKWCFMGFYIPLTKLDGTIKTRLEKSWLIIGKDKYLLNDAVKKY